MGTSLSAEGAAAAAGAIESIEVRLTRSRVQLALEAPFLASAVMRLPLRAVGAISWCPTMATDGYHLFYNPGWCATLTDAQTRGVLAHEVLHALLDHSGRRGNREPRAWNIACDVAINLMLIDAGFELPAGGWVLREYQGKTAEQIYGELPRDLARLAALFGHEGEGLLPGLGADAEGEPDAAGVLPGAGADLLDPEHPAVIPLRDQDAPDREQLRELRANLRAQAAAHLHGQTAGWFRQECAMAAEARIDWRAVLRHWLHDRIRTDWSSWPYAKKHLHRGLYLPSMGVESPGTIVFAIDTSASMTIELLSRVVAELRAFRETFPCELMVIQADAAVQSIEHYEAMDGTEVPAVMTVAGRGGTDFRPVFAQVAGQGLHGSMVMIYATDGYGTFPEQAPPWPVIWLVTPDGATEVPFGVRVPVRE
jgi:predicted metal-dependent peptidase